MYKEFGKCIKRKQNKEMDRLVGERIDRLIRKLRGRIGKKKSELESLMKLSRDPLHAKEQEWMKAKLRSLKEELEELEIHLKKYAG